MFRPWCPWAPREASLDYSSHTNLPSSTPEYAVLSPLHPPLYLAGHQATPDETEILRSTPGKGSLKVGARLLLCPSQQSTQA